MPLKVTVWGENKHEKTNKDVQKIYPKGMHTVIADALNKDKEIKAITATLDQAEHGLTQKVLDDTDVLSWWGHAAHGDVKDEIVDRVQKRVLEGMGLIVLHSGHHSKIFKRLLGTSCDLTWREAGERERLWMCNPGHAIAQGIKGTYFELAEEEMYGEPFGIPNPDEVVFLSWFQGGEAFRSGVTYKRGAGKIFYFRPGHETYPTYHDANVQTVLRNAVKWAKPEGRFPAGCPNVPVEKALEKIVAKGASVH
ncbi:MAG: ThuA domain-containing protein [Planctomycetes bacterium]|nr:ThuA domain-containing protein [Planctomycetota bacterium]